MQQRGEGPRTALRKNTTWVFLIRIRNVSKYNEANNFSIPPPTVYDMNHIDIMPKTGSYFWSIVIKQVGWG